MCYCANKYISQVYGAVPDPCIGCSCHVPARQPSRAMRPLRAYTSSPEGVNREEGSKGPSSPYKEYKQLTLW